MGYFTLPPEADAPKMARAAYARDIGRGLTKKRAAECAEHLAGEWRKMAETPCSICSKPIGWDSRYMIDRDGPDSTLSHAACNWKRAEEASQ